ncbi:MAG: DinB family protein [Phycisphaerales bacterium]|nr:DinB family protein [Phycisphaerales bacterium]
MTPSTGLADRMDLSRLIDRLEAFPAMLGPLLNLFDEADLHWSPDHGGWCATQIMGHLLCEERQDFGPRLARLLENPRQAWDPIDPDAAVEQGNWADVPATLESFSQARASSVKWLRTLDVEAMGTIKTHPRFGSMSGGDLMAAWTAHDALHLRQLARRLHELAVRDGLPFDASYAGDW